MVTVLVSVFIALSSRIRCDVFEASEYARPTAAHAAIAAFVLRPEARLLHAHMRSVCARCQCPGDDGLEPAFSLFAGCVPAIDETLVGNDFQHFAVGDAIPTHHWLGAKVEFVAD